MAKMEKASYIHIDFSSSNSVDSYAAHVTHVYLNREPIADQSQCRVLQSRMLKYAFPFIILRLAFTIGSHIHVGYVGHV